MSGGDSTSTTATSDPLRRAVATGTETPVTVAPYEVLAVHVPSRWDPSSETLAVSYDINNPNARAIRGQILYRVPGTFDPRPDGAPPGQPVVVHRQSLSASQVRSGCFELPEGQRWDGTISEGLSDRVGQKVTADLAPVVVVVEIWNRSTARPGNRTQDNSGTTDVRGEFLARGRTRAELDVIAEARWERDHVIPYDDPDEPNKGKVRMIIRVRNVQEGTAARLFIYRIVNVDDPWSDRMYAYTGANPDGQPGLEGATVRNGRIVLADGTDPEVRFNDYARHWTIPGNNFYCFRVAFGNRGGGIRASERDYVNHERQCLHMRFTVFIHRSAGDLPEYTTYASRLHSFFRSQTRYYRSYLMTGSPRSLDDWRRHFQHRYIVIIFGHAACGCEHNDHPRAGGVPTGDRLDLFHRGFAPDQNCCPRNIESTPEAQQQLQADRQHYHHDFGGCGHKSHVRHYNSLGNVSQTGSRTRTRLWIANQAPPSTENDLLVWPDPNGSAFWMNLANTGPRVFLWNGGCRSILTTNAGEHYVNTGTRYYHGWIYSPACDYGKFAYDVFNRWIKGTSANPAPDEYDIARLLPAYRDAATSGTRPRYYPRIMDRASGVLNPAAPPTATEGALA